MVWGYGHERVPQSGKPKSQCLLRLSPGDVKPRSPGAAKGGRFRRNRAVAPETPLLAGVQRGLFRPRGSPAAKPRYGNAFSQNENCWNWPPFASDPEPWPTSVISAGDGGNQSLEYESAGTQHPVNREMESMATLREAELHHQGRKRSGVSKTGMAVARYRRERTGSRSAYSVWAPECGRRMELPRKPTLSAGQGVRKARAHKISCHLYLLGL